MLPYATLMISARWLDGRVLRVGAEDPIPGGVTIRTADTAAFAERPAVMRFSFLKYREKRYESVTVTDFSLTAESETLLRFETEDAIFHACLRELLRAYAHYIEFRQKDDYTLMQEMTGFDFDDEAYPSDVMAWKRAQTRLDAKPYTFLPETEIAVCADCGRLYDALLHMGREELLSFYWRDNALEKHPISRQPVTHIYLGNAFCPHLLPDDETLYKLIIRARELSLTPVVVFSPMSEEQTGQNEKTLLRLAEWGIREVVVNDSGLALMIRESGLDFHVTAGVLMTKRKKDFRIPYRSECERERQAYEQTSADAPVYRRYLKERLGIESVSYEVCGYPFHVTGPADVLHLPLYQMNTSGYCTLNALCTAGDRAQQHPVTECPGYCERKAVLYPEGLPMIGKGNTIFGCSMDELNSADTLNDLIRSGIHRLVVRL